MRNFHWEILSLFCLTFTFTPVSCEIICLDGERFLDTQTGVMTTCEAGCDLSSMKGCSDCCGPTKQVTETEEIAKRGRSLKIKVATGITAGLFGCLIICGVMYKYIKLKLLCSKEENSERERGRLESQGGNGEDGETLPNEEAHPLKLSEEATRSNPTLNHSETNCPVNEGAYGGIPMNLCIGFASQKDDDYPWKLGINTI